MKYLCYAMLGVSTAMVAVGAILGQPESVLNKAVRVCLECIGIG